MVLGITVSTVGTLLFYLESGFVDPAHDEENIETLLTHFDELRDQEEKDRAVRLIQQRGTTPQKEHIAKMT